MIATTDTPRISALKKVFAAYRADTSPLLISSSHTFAAASIAAFHASFVAARTIA